MSGVSIAASTSIDVIAGLVADVLEGTDPRAVVALHQTMSNRPDGQRVRPAVAALDIALWDLKARAHDEPLWKTLGASANGANVHVCDPDSRSSPQDSGLALAELAGANGIFAGKLALGTDQTSNGAGLDAMRNAFLAESAAPVLMVEPAIDWSGHTVVDNIQQLEKEFDLASVDAPAGVSDPAELQRLSASVFAAICAGRGLSDVREYLPYFERQAIDIVEINIANSGITGAIQIANAAYGLELPVLLCEYPGHLGAHLAMALPNFMSLEISATVNTPQGVTSDVCIEAGRAIVSAQAGNGLAIVPGAVADADAKRDEP
jgi:L-alanine-DL-glutamate epimerase-like enolase superfamily enzyme